MYQPPHFIEERPEVMHALIRAHPLGLLICSDDSGPIANPVPFDLRVEVDGSTTLLAHLARANPALAVIAANPDRPVLAVFQGAQAYVTPGWYATKAETGKVVPTWNYTVVQARGTATLFDTPQAMRAHLDGLTGQMERRQAQPWKVGDAPGDFLERQMRAIVGLHIAVTALEGKWKVSQNRNDADRAGVEAGLRETGADAMADLVRDAK